MDETHVCGWSFTQRHLCYKQCKVMKFKRSVKLRFACVLWKDTAWLSWTCCCFVKVTLSWLFHLSKPKSVVIKRVPHAEWHSLTSEHIQGTQTLLGQVTGSVTLNKSAVPIQPERAGCRSACINIRRLQGVALSTLVTTAEPGRLLGRHGVTPATVMSPRKAEHFFLSTSLSFKQHLELLRRILRPQWHGRKAL